MDDDAIRINRTNGVTSWRAGCGESRTSGSEGGPEKPTDRNVGRALRSDPYTKLKGPSRGFYFNLYVVLDIFSRYVVNWLVAEHEDKELAKDFLEDAIVTQGVSPTRSQSTRTVVRPCALNRSPNCWST
jgi:transposase InsO family protein